MTHVRQNCGQVVRAATCWLEINALNVNSHNKYFEFTHGIQKFSISAENVTSHRKCEFTIGRV
jgi:hypothetical protein